MKYVKGILTAISNGVALAFGILMLWFCFNAVIYGARVEAGGFCMILYGLSPIEDRYQCRDFVQNPFRDFES